MHTLVQFDFMQDQILENHRVLLRPLCMEDVKNLEEYICQEPEIWNYSLVAMNNFADLENYIETALKDRKAQIAYPYIIFDKQKNKYVGCTRFYDVQLSNASALIGYTWLSQATWGSGLNTHCKYLLLSHAFEKMGLMRIEFRVDDRNKRSRAALEKMGCTVEGKLRNHLPIADGSRRDTIVLSILASEWHLIKAGFLARIEKQG